MDLYVFIYLFILLPSPLSDTEAGEKAAKEEAVVENATPDYAAGLVSAQVCDKELKINMFVTSQV